MKTSREIVALGRRLVLAVFICALTARAQAGEDPTAGLQLVASNAVPSTGTFFLLSSQEGLVSAPWPFDPYNNTLPVYAIDLINGSF